MRQFRLPRISLRARLILLLMVVFIPMVGLLAVIDVESRQRATNEVRDNALTRVRLLKADQEQSIIEARTLLSTLARVRDVRSDDPAQCTARLKEEVQFQPTYAGFGVAEADGDVTCSSVELSSPVNAIEENLAWFRRAVDTRSFAVGDFQTGRETGRPILVFSYPILSEGKVEGVVFAAALLEALGELAERANLTGQSAILFIDRNGTILDHHPNPEAWIGKTAADEPIIQTILSQKEGVIESSGLDGVTRLYAFTSIRGGADTGLYLAVGVPTQTAYAEVNQTTLNHLVFLGSIAILSLLAAIFFADQFMVRQINAMVAATRRLRQGDLSTRIRPVSETAELDQLAIAFNDMAATLQEREAAQKQAEATIHEQREFLRVTLTSIGDAVLATDTDSRVTFMNPIAEMVTGWTRDEAAGRPLSEIFPIINEATRKPVENPAARVLREGAIVGLGNHTLLVRRDGSEIPIDDSGAPIRDDTGRLDGVVLVFRDVTDRRRAEKELIEREQRFRLVANSAPVMIWQSGVDKLFDWFNKGWLEYTGRAMEQELGNGWTEGVHPDDIERCLNVYTTAFDARREFEMEYRLKRADGAYRWVLDRGTPRYLPDGEFLGYIGSCIDIHDRKEALRRLEIQYAVARTLAESTTVTETYHRVLQSVCEGLSWKVGALWCVDGDAGVLRNEAMWHAPDIDAKPFEQAHSEMTFSLGMGLPGRVWVSGRLAWVSDLQGDDNFFRKRQALAASLGVGLAFPIHSGGDIIAVIEGFTSEIQQPRQGLLDMLDAIGSQIGNFIERKRVEEAVKIRARQQAVVAELGQRASARVSPSELMADTVARIADTLNVPLVKILELAPDGENLRLIAGFGWNEELIGRTIISAEVETHAGYTLHFDGPVFMDDLQAETRFEGSPLLHQYGVISGITVSMRRHEQRFGVLGVHTTQKRTFTEDDAHFMEAIANLLAVTLERQQAEDALRESERRFRALANAAPMIVWTAAPDGTVTYANDRWFEYAGVAPEENPENWPELVLHPDDYDRCMKKWTRALQTGEEYEIEVRNRRHDGAFRWFLTRAIPTRDDEGRITAWYGTTTDIHDRKLMEEDLRLSHDQLAVILENVADGITAQDPSGRMVYANEAAARIMGFPLPQELISASPEEITQNFQIFDEMNRPVPITRLPGRSALRGIVPAPVVLRFRVVSTGEERWSITKARPILNEHGQAVMAVNIFQDVTELKRAEQAQRLLAQTSRLMTDSISYADRLGKIADLLVPEFADWCAIDVLDSHGKIQRAAMAHVDPDKVALAHEMNHRYPHDPDATNGVPHVLRSGETEFYPEITDEMLGAWALDAEHLQVMRDLGIRSALIVPLQAHGRTLGAMTLVWAESGRRYTLPDVALAEEVARRMTLALEHARLYEAEQKARQTAEQTAERVARLQFVTASLAGALTPDQVGDICIKQSVAALGARAGSVALLTDEGKTLGIVAHAGYPPTLIERWQKFPVSSTTPLGDAMLSHQLIFLGSRREAIERYPLLARELTVGQGSWVAVPLQLEGRAIGALGLSFSRERALSAEEHEFILALSGQFAQAFERARLYEAESRARAQAEAARQRLAFLAEASQTLSVSTGLNERLNTLGRLVVPLLADWMTINLVEPDGSIRLVAAAHRDLEKESRIARLAERYPLDPEASSGTPLVLRTGRPEMSREDAEAVLLEDSRDAEYREAMLELGFESYLIVPLQARGRTIGAMTLVSARAERRYDQGDLALAEELADRVAISIDNALLYEESQQLNAELEQRVARRTAQLQAINDRLRRQIAERREAQEALQRSQRQYEELVHAVDGIVWEADPQTWGFRFVSQQAERLLGYPSARWLTEPAFWQEHIHPDDREQVSAFAKAAMDEKRSYDREYRMLAADGRDVWLRDIVSVIVKDGQVVKVQGVMTDISQRKNAELELAEMRRRLTESREAERLHLAQELHDGPVQDLYGLSYRLAALRAEVHAKSALDQLTAGQQSLNQVIQTLRTMSSELRPPTLAPFGLETAIRSHAERFQEQHPEIEIRLDLTPDQQQLPEPVRLALFRIYQQMLVNVIRHAGANRVTIRFRVEDTRATLEIEDDGRGFNLPSRWLDLARKGHFGLVGAVERAESVGGTLKVISALGQGTRIQVDVPRAAGLAADSLKVGVPIERK